MKQRACLNLYHSAYCKRMKKLAIERSKQPPMSPVEFMNQVQRLRRGSIHASSVR